ncbi:Glutathione gamma-glutamylcysteinyltransferase [Planoprotostelium fungivorum]|uniref:glutathione gamma-glutamylcysteinyltransferase n=1 Tax=Planoprotostelium fungivorum TaxID=1890364 RepID=A0A2P6NRY5_9EUKA|nr:Glutathione gamma-glutamylcysteinyltransferase [Planoprotostelium fungivorum]
MQPTNVRGFYRRPLPDTCVAFESAEGRSIFRDALEDGGMECYFPLAAQFHTQADPAFCGLGTLSMILNAFQIDPGRIWMGPWRWYSETFLDCCLPLEEVQKNGITLPQFVCLADCNGLLTQLNYASESDVQKFRNEVSAACRKPEKRVVVVSYDRRGLGQTGAGHFSPVGGYDQRRDMVLLLDVARFKYPPHWVSLTLLFDSMKSNDPATERSRGFVTLTDGGTKSKFCTVNSEGKNVSWSRITKRLSKNIREGIERKGDVCEAILDALFSVEEGETTKIVETISFYSQETRGGNTVEMEEFIRQIQSLAAFHFVTDYVTSRSLQADREMMCELATIAFLSCPDTSITETPDTSSMHRYREMMRETGGTPMVKEDVDVIQRNLIAICQCSTLRCCKPN